MFINMWPVENVQSPYGYNFNLKSIGWSVDRDTVFIFDNAESTYVDSDHWTGLFKNIHDYPRRRTILFSSYGSPSRFITGRGSRFCVKYSQMVTLRAVQHQDDFPATGLLFFPVEFDDLISKDKYLFDSSFFNEVFNASGGHLGAVKAFLSVITAHGVGLCCVNRTCWRSYTIFQSYQVLKHFSESDQQYTYQLFMEKVGLREFLDMLDSASKFKRGLPTTSDLKDLATARVFSLVLCYDVVEKSDLTPNEHSERD